MRRRDFIQLVGVVCLSSSLARAQTKRPPARIGVLWHAGSEAEEDPYFGWLRQGFREVGLVEGKDIVFEDRYPDEKPELFEKHAKELANEKLDVLIAVSIPSALAAQRATATIPIVFTPPPDPVALGLVASLPRPGGNITGFSSMGNDVVAKRFHIFKEAIPSLSRVALLLNPTTPQDADRAVMENRVAGDLLKVSIEPVIARLGSDLERAFAEIAERKCDGVIVSQNPMVFAERGKIADLALARTLPTLLPAEVFVEAGGLMSYGARWQPMYTGVAQYVKRILSGEKTAEIPVQQPVEFDLCINMKTAQSLQISLPATIIARADKVIE